MEIPNPNQMIDPIAKNAVNRGFRGFRFFSMAVASVQYQGDIIRYGFHATKQSFA